MNSVCLPASLKCVYVDMCFYVCVRVHVHVRVNRHGAILTIIKSASISCAACSCVPLPSFCFPQARITAAPGLFAGRNHLFRPGSTLPLPMTHRTSLARYYHHHLLHHCQPHGASQSRDLPGLAGPRNDLGRKMAPCAAITVHTRVNQTQLQALSLSLLWYLHLSQLLAAVPGPTGPLHCTVPF